MNLSFNGPQNVADIDLREGVLRRALEMKVDYIWVILNFQMTE
jgi:hypothetical protein